MRLMVAVGVVGAFLAAPRAQAQVRSLADGLRLNVHAGAARLGDTGADGVGVRPGLSASYGNSRLFSVFMTYDRVPMHDGAFDFDLKHIDLGARVHLRGPRASLVPFVFGAYTWRSANYGDRPLLGITQNVKVYGGGVTLGAGTAYYLSRRLALELVIMRSGGTMGRVVADGNIFTHEESIIRDASIRVNVGVSWWIPRP
jgi:hypothetical protein